VRVAIVDIADPTTLAPVLRQSDVVVNTVGPFTRVADPIVSICLEAGTAYVDIANELSAVRALLDRDEDAQQCGVQLVTGAGFGVVATETLAVLLAQSSAQPLRSIQVAAAQAVAYSSKGVQATIAEGMAQGSPHYVESNLVVDPLGTGATTLQFPDGPRQVIPAAVGDLIAAQRATGAPNAIAYAALRANGSAQADRSEDMHSLATALACGADGAQFEADITFGEGFAASAAIAVEVALRTIRDPKPGAWTPGQLFGTELAEACGAVIRGPRPCTS
jgi:saccharopine dehydrogenase (NAD+, L-lysine-forming)